MIERGRFFTVRPTLPSVCPTYPRYIPNHLAEAIGCAKCSDFNIL